MRGGWRRVAARGRGEVIENEKGEEAMSTERAKHGLARCQVLLGGAATALALGLGAAAGAQVSPKSGGRLRLGLTHGNTADDHDPATGGPSALVDLRLVGAGDNHLTEISPHGQVVSAIAASLV